MKHITLKVLLALVTIVSSVIVASNLGAGYWDVNSGTLLLVSILSMWSLIIVMDAE